jgi:hypothetical protein
MISNAGRRSKGARARIRGALVKAENKLAAETVAKRRPFGAGGVHLE